MMQEVKYTELSKTIANQLAALTSFDSNDLEKLKSDFNVLLIATTNVMEMSVNEQQFFSEKFSEIVTHFEQLILRERQLTERIGQLSISLEGKQHDAEERQRQLDATMQRRNDLLQQIKDREKDAEWKWYYIFFPILGLLAWAVIALINNLKKDVKTLELEMERLQNPDNQNVINEIREECLQLESELIDDRNEINEISREVSEAETKKKEYAIKASGAQGMKASINQLEIYLQDMSPDLGHESLIEAYLQEKIDFRYVDGSNDISLHEAIFTWGVTLDKKLNANGKNVQAVHLEYINEDDKSTTDIGHLYHVEEKVWRLGSHFQEMGQLPEGAEIFDQSFDEYARDAWSTYAWNNDKSLHLQINLWLRTASIMDMKTKEKIVAKLIDGATTAKINFCPGDHLPLKKINEICLKNNWRIASAFEVSIAWTYSKLHVFALGRLADGRFAVPIQYEINEWKKGINIVESGDQGFFYIDNND